MAPVSKILTTILLLLLVTTAFAGGPDTLPQPGNAYAGFYLEANVAYSYINWADYGVIAFTQPPFLLPHGKLRSGFAGGLDVGYQFNEHLALELGSYNLPTARLQQLTPPPNFPILVSYRSWLVYLTAKLMVPVDPYAYIFFKVGPAYRKVTRNNSFTGTIEAYYWAPMFGVGVQFYITESVMVSLQYERISGYQCIVSSSDRLNAPGVNLVVAALGYKFYW